MRLTLQDLRYAHYRNINLANPDGTPQTDTNTDNDFYMNLGQRYQLALAKLANYRTVAEYIFSTGMSSTLVSSGVATPIFTITSSSTTATVVTSSAHGYSTGNTITINGVSPSGYNGTYTITVTNSTTFTYTLAVSIANVSGTTSQYYAMPQGEVTIEGMYITIGSVNYPLRAINTRWNWEQLNAILIQASAIPQFYFVTPYAFGIWPIPQAIYTGHIFYHYRDRNLSVADYATGTVTVTQNSFILAGSGTTFTSAMVGRWFTVTDSTIYGQGYWFQIVGYTDSTHLIMSSPWTNTTATTGTGLYRIGESPNIPEEGCAIFPWGTASDYYAGMRKDPANATSYDNLFWTGSPVNPSRKEGDSNITGGLLGLINRYSDRDDRRLIKRKPKLNPLQYKVFATSLS